MPRAETHLQFYTRRMQEEMKRADTAEAQLQQVRATLKQLIDFAHGATMPIEREG